MLLPSVRSSVLVRASPTTLLAEIQSNTPLPVVRRISLDTPALVGSVNVTLDVKVGGLSAA